LNTRAASYSWYVLGVLCAVSIVNYYDRNLISILVEPMKHDLHASDSELGLLTGFAFALAYGAFGIPVARLADRWGRARVLGLSLLAWSVTTILSAQCRGFTSMALARAGVAIGEAGALPATHALVAEYFDEQRRGRALSLIGVAGGLGVTLALAAGGLINEWYGWRMAFVLSGIPGLFLAVLLWVTVREPEPGLSAAAGAGPAAGTSPTASVGPAASGLPAASDEPSLGEALRALWHRPAYVCLCAGLGIAVIGIYGQFAWTPAFLMRSYHMSSAAVGGYYSVVVGPATLLSIFLGGVLNDWLVRKDPRAPFWILAGSFALVVPANLTFFLVHDFSFAMGISLVTTVIGGVWVAPAYSLVQSLAGPRLRAIAAAVFMMTVNVVGMGLGPFLTGALSDHFASAWGDQALAVSLCVVTLIGGLGVFPLLRATKTVTADVARAAAIA
jgi:MFS family permease